MMLKDKQTKEVIIMLEIIDRHSNKTLYYYNELTFGQVSDFKAKCLMQAYFMEHHVLLPKAKEIKAVAAKLNRSNWTLDNLAIK